MDKKALKRIRKEVASAVNAGKKLDQEVTALDVDLRGYIKSNSPAFSMRRANSEAHAIGTMVTGIRSLLYDLEQAVLAAIADEENYDRTARMSESKEDKPSKRGKK